MTLTINGKSHTIPDGASLTDAVTSLCKTPERVIAELNGAIIDRSAWDQTRLKTDDRLELITFVGGG